MIEQHEIKAMMHGIGDVLKKEFAKRDDRLDALEEAEPMEGSRQMSTRERVGALGKSTGKAVKQYVDEKVSDKASASRVGELQMEIADLKRRIEKLENPRKSGQVSLQQRSHGGAIYLKKHHPVVRISD